jgi:hypothetical protein
MYIPNIYHVPSIASLDDQKERSTWVIVSLMIVYTSGLDCDWLVSKHSGSANNRIFD